MHEGGTENEAKPEPVRLISIRIDRTISGGRFVATLRRKDGNLIRRFVSKHEAVKLLQGARDGEVR